MNKKIIDLYKRRQKAHDELLACDVKLDMMLRKKSIPEITIKEKLIEKIERDLLEYDGDWIMRDDNGYCTDFSKRQLINMIEEI